MARSFSKYPQLMDKFCIFLQSYAYGRYCFVCQLSHSCQQVCLILFSFIYKEIIKKFYNFFFSLCRKTLTVYFLFNNNVFIRNSSFIHNNCRSNCNFIKKETPALVFSCKFCKIFKNTFFTLHLRTTASVTGLTLSLIILII